MAVHVEEEENKAEVALIFDLLRDDIWCDDGNFGSLESEPYSIHIVSA